MNIIALRKTIGDEPGTHMADTEISNGRDSINTRGFLFLQAEGDPKLPGDTIATVVGGCTKCLNIYPLKPDGNERVTIRRTESAWFIMG